MSAETIPPSGFHSPTDVPDTVTRRIVAFACRAPSIYNTQPWAWRLRPDGVDLYADHQRRLHVADPSGRELILSCGAALHHATVAARALGWAPVVHRFPDPAAPALLAEIRLSPVLPPRSAAGDLAALQDRRTDRRRFTSWPVPDERLERLAAEAREWDTGAVAVTDVTDRFRAELLVSRAFQLQARDPDVAAELGRWVDRRGGEGVPSETVPDRPGPDASHHSRYGLGSLEDSGRDIEGSDGLVVICGDCDDRAAWLRAGEGLSALWLHAVRQGLSVVPLSQVVEVPETRVSLRQDLLGGLAEPLLVVRVGWQAISRSHLEPTPRRDLQQVLLPPDNL
jgi:nitroreductase